MLLYVTFLAVGAVALLVSFTMADFDHDGLPFVSLSSIAASLVAAGGAGIAVTALGHAVLALPAAGVAAAATYAVSQAASRWMRSQGSPDASPRSRTSYIGCVGEVTLPIPENGWGLVRFADSDGVPVNSKAVSMD